MTEIRAQQDTKIYSLTKQVETLTAERDNLNVQLKSNQAEIKQLQ